MATGRITSETQRVIGNNRRRTGYRSITTVGESYEVNYSFDREQRFCNLRLTIPAAGGS